MRILIVGSGGREHALAWALSIERGTEVFAAPGNPGIAEIAACVPIEAVSVLELASFAARERFDLTVVGPEAPLAAGIVDRFREGGLRVFGPDSRGARIESSKSFAKSVCVERGIPTPRWSSFADAGAARRALDRFGPPWVVKADGLAAGKGTTVTGDRGEAEAAIRREMARESGRVVVEEFVDGWEASFTATVSGGRVQWLAPVFQDYKPIYDGDAGPNSGGMGVYSPVSQVDGVLVERVRSRILDPSVQALTEKGISFQGVLYLNVIVRHGTRDPLLLEFNARFGDPEMQGIAPLVRGGLLQHMLAVAEDSVDAPNPEIGSEASVVVVLAAKGYPVQPSSGEVIRVGRVPENVRVFHAGTARKPTGELVTAGGRVLNVAATGPNVESARKDAYSVIGEIVGFDGMQYRSDIGDGRVRHRRLVANAR